MLPQLLITWPGSTDKLTLYTYQESRGAPPEVTRAARDEIAEVLKSRYPAFFAPKPTPYGGHQSVDQLVAWPSMVNDIGIEGGAIVLLRHTSSNNHIIGCAMAKANGMPGEAELVVHMTGGYASEEVWFDDQHPAKTIAEHVLDRLRAECLSNGLKLGRAETRRVWVAL